MSFVISSEKFQNSIKEGDIYIKGDYYKNKKGLIIKQGDIFNYNDKEPKVNNLEQIFLNSYIFLYDILWKNI